MTDPIADMLTALRNAIAVRKDTLTVPYSKLREAIAKLLQEEGYIKEVTTVPAGGKSKFSRLQLGLKYSSGGLPIIHGIRRTSRPGQRIYSSSPRLHKVLGGVGTSVISTSTGLMTDHEARKKGIGGEVLFRIW